MVTTGIKVGGLIVLAAAVAWACSVTSSQVDKNKEDMSIRQGVMKSVYPALTAVTRLFGINNRTVLPPQVVEAPTAVYGIAFELIDGSQSSLAPYKGKKILVVNTASDCGYTGQYEELQQLYAQHKDNLVVVGFPANDFKEQEKGSNAEIASFCKKNYGVEFPLAMKTSVVKGPEQHPLFSWLSDPAQNGWNSEAPKWNFSKYLIDEQGRLVGYFDPGVSPTGKQITQSLDLVRR